MTDYIPPDLLKVIAQAPCTTNSADINPVEGTIVDPILQCISVINGGHVISKVDNSILCPISTALKEKSKLGQLMSDGAIFAGTTADGKYEIHTLSADLAPTTFDGAVIRINKLNRKKMLGYDDWEIPSLENLIILRENKNEGALKDSFNTNSGSGDSVTFPGWYWSSTVYRDRPSYVWSIKFSIDDHDDKDEDWVSKGARLFSCRPIRLVEITP